MAYKGIENIKAKEQAKPLIAHKKLHIVSVLFFCLIVLSAMGVGVSGNVSVFVKRVTARWNPKTEDFGKIKYVNFFVGDKNNSVFIVSSPFKNYYANNLDSTTLEVFGLGDVVVLCPIDGVVKDVEIDNQKYTVKISNGNVVVILSGLDNLCAKKQEKLNKGDKIAVSLESRIVFQIVCDGEKIELPASEIGDTFFE